MKRALVWPLLFGLLGLGLLFASAALAAPYQPATSPRQAGPLFQETITPTTTTTHPVAAAIAKFFDVPYAEIWDLHQEGYGFGVIAKAYFAAQKLGELGQDILPTDLLADFDSGTGWGVIFKKYDLPGRAGRGGNLGDIMSANKKGESLDSLGVGRMPPGQLKKDKGKSDDEQGDRGPGKDKDKGDKGKGRDK